MANLLTIQNSKILFIILIFLTISLLYNLGGWGVIETSEARYAEISREMWQNKDWFHPQLLGIQHFHKPPVTYILSALGMGIFGANAFGARFFLQLSFLLQVWLVYLIGKQIFNDNRRAFVAAIIYITVPAALISVRNLTTDSFLTTFELVAIFSWLKYRNEVKIRWIYLFYIALAIAFLTKGPVGLILPALIAFGYKKQTISDKSARLLHHIPAALLFLIIGASWYIYLMVQDAQFVDYFLYKHTVQRYVNPEAFARFKPWWFYLVFAPLISLPWSAILLADFKTLKTMPASLKRLFLMWLLVPLIFFSLSGSKLILYILPLFAGLALLCAWLLTALTTSDLKKALNWAFLYFLLLASAFLIFPILPVGIKLPLWSMIFPAVMIGLIITFWKIELPRLQKILYCSLTFTILLLPFSTHFLGNNPQLTNNSRLIANIIKQKHLQNRAILVYNRLLPSLAFELDRAIISIDDGNGHLKRETQFEKSDKWQEALITMDDPKETGQLKDLLQHNSVLIVKDELPKERAWMLNGFDHRIKAGKWLIYYKAK